MTSGIEPRQLLTLVVRPALTLIGLGGPAAEQLMMGTIAQESSCGRYLHQLGGPAVGLDEIEPRTHDDLWVSFLPRYPDLAAKLRALVIDGMPRSDQMAGNLYYAVAMGRLVYYRSPDPLPAFGAIAGQAAFYKKTFNTAGGAATVDQYLANYRSLGLTGAWPA